MDERAQIFEPHRSRLHGIAYRMLSSRADADDVVQDAYLRWHRAVADEVRSPEAWLVTTVTRLCIDRLRAARTEREAYVGPWLPEPIVEQAEPADSATELASSLSVAFLAVLERLAPEERAAFLLHDVFDSDYDEIARILGKSETACRQIVSRARKRDRADQPRVHVPETARRSLLNRFVTALQSQDKSALLQVLSDDVTWTSDGGGKAKAARKVVQGADHVSRFVMGVIGRFANTCEMRPVTVNGQAGIAMYGYGRLISIITVNTDGARILGFYSVLNPDKLRGLS